MAQESVKIVQIPRERIVLWAVFLIAFAFALLSSSRRFFGDDFCLFSMSSIVDGCVGGGPLQDRRILDSSIAQAKSQDRFYQIIFYTISQIILMNSFFSAFVKIVITLATCYFIFRIATWFLGSQFGLASLVVFVATYPLLGYNSLTNLPGWFNVGALGFLIFFDQFLRVYLGDEFDKERSKVLLYVGFLVSLLSYEMYVGIYVALLVLVGIHSQFLRRGREEVKSLFRDRTYWTLWFLILLYLCVYVTFLLLWPGSYGGTDVSRLSPVAVVTTLASLSLGAIPLSVYSGIHATLADASKIKITGLASIDNIHPVALIAGALFVLAIIFCLAFLLKSESSLHLPRIHWLLILSMIFLPNILLSLTQRYRDWSLAYPFYLTTLNSHIFLCIFLVAFAAKYISKSRYLKVFVAFVFIPTLFLATLSKVSYLSESIHFNESLRSLGNRTADVSSGTRPDYRKLDKEIGAFPYRFAEVYLRRR